MSFGGPIFDKRFLDQDGLALAFGSEVQSRVMTGPVSVHVSLEYLYVACHRGEASVFWLRLIGTLTVVAAVGVRDRQGGACESSGAAVAASSLTSRNLSFALRTAVRWFLVGRTMAPYLMLGRSGHVSLSAWCGPWHTAH